MKYPNLDQFIQDELDRTGRIYNKLRVLSPDSAPDLVENPVALKSSSPVASGGQKAHTYLLPLLSLSGPRLDS